MTSSHRKNVRPVTFGQTEDPYHPLSYCLQKEVIYKNMLVGTDPTLGTLSHNWIAFHTETSCILPSVLMAFNNLSVNF